MQVEATNRALLSLVAELSEFGDEDVQAVLAELDLPARTRFLALLDAYRRGDIAETASASATSTLELSPWLTDRLTPDGEARSASMTSHASRALHRIAARHGWAHQSTGSPPPATARPWLARLGVRP